MKVVWRRKEEGAPRRKSVRRKKVTMQCTSFDVIDGKLVETQCSCSICIKFHRVEECYFGDGDKECNCSMLVVS